ncbi:F-box protein CPR1-like [Cornus florida]|uniref:F-box protein CPR1-like n=1 Tax=Cornus florida TaxID=4283 RepID=UPI0028990D43|nr:F-box protein CPR1-like [Cornus florida]
MCNGTSLPEAIIFNILSVLPVKTLCRFKCVSISCRTLISDPVFAKTQLDRNNKRERLILIASSLYSVDCTEASNSGAVTATNLNFPSTGWGKMVGSCNGLILLVNDERTMFLWNPSTSEFSELPKCPFYALNPVVPTYTMYGLGYVSSLDDYKVVIVLHYSNSDKVVQVLHYSNSDTFIGVYTLRTNSWSSNWIPDFPYHRIRGPESGVLVDGSLHWLAYKSSNHRYVICAFDLTDEKFRDVLVPRSLNYPNPETPNDLGVLGGCLTTLACRDCSQIDIWVMKEYGVSESWTKFTIYIKSMPFGPTLMFSPVDGVLLLIDRNKLVACNLKEETLRDIKVHGIPYSFRAKKTYVESLISPHYNVVMRENKGIPNLKREMKFLVKVALYCCRLILGEYPETWIVALVAYKWQSQSTLLECSSSVFAPQ